MFICPKRMFSDLFLDNIIVYQILTGYQGYFLRIWTPDREVLQWFDRYPLLFICKEVHTRCSPPPINWWSGWPLWSYRIVKSLDENSLVAPWFGEPDLDRSRHIYSMRQRCSFLRFVETGKKAQWLNRNKQGPFA